jgi:hypothetical protein
MFSVVRHSFLSVTGMLSYVRIPGDTIRNEIAQSLIKWESRVEKVLFRNRLNTRNRLMEYSQKCPFKYWLTEWLTNQPTNHMAQCLSEYLNKKFFTFIEPESLLHFAQESAIGLFSEPVEYTPHPHILLSMTHFIIVFPSTSMSPKRPSSFKFSD